MTRIGIILPTIPARAELLDRVLAAYDRTRPAGWEFDLTIPSDYPTVGEAWTAGADDVDGDYLFFAIDDAEPHPGWAETAVQTAEAGFIPAPRLERPDGTVESCGSLGWGVTLPEAPDGTPCRNTGLIFIRRDWWHEIGAFLPIHYSADDNWTWRAALHGRLVIHRSGMRFTHHHVVDQAVVAASFEHRYLAVKHAMTLRVPGKRVAAMTEVVS